MSDTGLYEQFLALSSKKANPSMTWEDISEIRFKCTGIKESPETLRKGAKIFYEYLNAGWISPPIKPTQSQNYKATKTIGKNGDVTSELSIAESNQIDYDNPDDLLRLHGYDPKRFNLLSAKNSKWNSGDKIMVSSKITVEPKKTTGPAVDDLDSWIRRLPQSVGSPQRDRIESDGDKLLLIPISDLHFNLCSSEFSSGNQYNIEDAKRIFTSCINDTIAKTHHYKFKKIIFLVGGDMMNSDGLNGGTTRGTPQDNCLGYFEACEELYAMVIRGIDTLLTVAPVNVIYVPGNHDMVTGYKLAKYIEAWYRNDPNVSVDTTPKPRKYFRFGKTLLVFAHDADIKTLPALIADEARGIWSKVNCTDVFLQHLHKEMVLKEEYHMRIQRLPSPSALSRWANNSGYGSLRQSMSFVYDKTKGRELDIHTVI